MPFPFCREAPAGDALRTLAVNPRIMIMLGNERRVAADNALRTLAINLRIMIMLGNKVLNMSCRERPVCRSLFAGKPHHFLWSMRKQAGRTLWFGLLVF